MMDAEGGICADGQIEMLWVHIELEVLGSIKIFEDLTHITHVLRCGVLRTNVFCRARKKNIWSDMRGHHMIDMSNERYSRELIGVLAGSGFRISMECGYREVVWQLNFMKRSSRYVLMERLRPWGSLVITVPR